LASLVSIPLNLPHPLRFGDSHLNFLIALTNYGYSSLLLFDFGQETGFQWSNLAQQETCWQPLHSHHGEFGFKETPQYQEQLNDHQRYCVIQEMHEQYAWA
jgi:hypothetical protein